MTELRVVTLPHGQGLPLPAYETAGSAGMDLRAAVGIGMPILIMPWGRALVPTGLALQIPPGFECQVRPRSGLAVKHGVTVLNAPGTVDSDYRGEVQVLLINLGAETFSVERGARIAQLVMIAVEKAVLVPVDSLDASERGEGGFGSTGR